MLVKMHKFLNEAFLVQYFVTFSWKNNNILIAEQRNIKNKKIMKWNNTFLLLLLKVHEYFPNEMVHFCLYLPEKKKWWRWSSNWSLFIHQNTIFVDGKSEWDREKQNSITFYFAKHFWSLFWWCSFCCCCALLARTSFSFTCGQWCEGHHNIFYLMRIVNIIITGI